MIQYVPIHPSQHDYLLGENFSTRFNEEMQRYYKPFSDKNRPIQLAKETWEYAVADSIPDATWVGAGHNIVDVETPNITIDVKGLSTNGLRGVSTEASILQNNKLEADNFNTFFKKKDFSGLYDMFVEPLIKKVTEAKRLHVMTIVRDKTTGAVGYVLFKVIESSDSQISEMTLMGKRSVSVPMIDNQYGKTYLYIPKRRMEIRLNMSGILNYLVWSHNVKNILV